MAVVAGVPFIIPWFTCQGPLGLVAGDLLQMVFDVRRIFLEL